MFRLTLFSLSLFAISPALAIDSHSANHETVNVLKHTLPIGSSFLIASRQNATPPTPEGLKGWDYMYGRLVDQGVSPDFLTELLQDPSMPHAEVLRFGLDPKEPRHLYSRFHTSKAQRAAASCFQAHRSTFEQASKKYGVPAGVLAAIVHVETSCGRNVGRSPVFYRLLRLASAGDPNTIEINFQEKSANKGVTREKVEARGKYLENTFFPHALAALMVASERGVDPLELRGSEAGAVGMPQFLPGNYLEFGVDGDKDGSTDLFTSADAIPSVGNLLKHYGWKSPTLSTKAKREVIWHYNRSAPYIDAVLSLATSVERTKVKQALPKRGTPLNRLRKSPAAKVKKAPASH